MMAFNPTTNRVPFGLLEQHERIALTKWPHGWEWYSITSGRWLEATGPDEMLYEMLSSTIYRGKPAPQEDV